MIKELFAQQREALDYFFDHLNLEQAEKMIDKMIACKGSLFFSGVGKSGIIAKKLVATFISIGIKAFYLPPTNALHGDLGVICKDDMVIYLSKSGETKELLQLSPFIKRRNVFSIAWVSQAESSLSKICDMTIELPLLKELCPYNLVPTNSATIQLLFGDLLCVSLMRKKNVTIADYSDNHPAGSIGKKARLKVKDLMLQGQEIPVCYESELLKNVLPTLSEKKCGCILVLDHEFYVKGIFTDGDLRRALEQKKESLFDLQIENLMVKDFLSIDKETLLNDAFSKMQLNPSKKITSLPVLEGGKLLGLLRLQDLLSV